MSAQDPDPALQMSNNDLYQDDTLSTMVVNQVAPACEHLSELTPIAAKKRKTRNKTLIVDDEVRRSSRLMKTTNLSHIQLDNEPRKKKGAPTKTVSFSPVEDFKQAIVSSNLELPMDDVEVQPIQSLALVELGTTFCGVPPKELNNATLPPEEKK